MKELGDSGIQPLSQPWLCKTSRRVSFNLSRLNRIAIVSLPDSESTKCGLELFPLVMNGPLPSIQVHCKLDFVGGCQGGLFEMGGILMSTGLVFVLRMTFRCSWLDSNVYTTLIKQ